MVVVVIMRHAPGSRGVQRRRHRRGFGEPHSPGTLHRKPARCRTEVPLFGTDPAYIHHERRRALGDHQDRRLVVTPNKGEAGQNIQVTVTPALNQGEARDGEFTIRANSGNNLHPCLTEKSIPLSQDAYLAAGIVITGLDERLLAFEAEDTDPVVFTVETSYDWTLTVENETWLTVAPKSGKAGSAAQVTITPKANTTDERHESKITITAGDAEFGENTAEEIIELVQAPYMPKDTHAEGYVFFSDDFQWIPDNWVSPYTKYGWPSVSIDGTNGNEP